MMQLYYKYTNESNRLDCLNFLRHSGYWNDIEIEIPKSILNRMVISLEESDSEDFISKSKYKGFRFHEVS